MGDIARRPTAKEIVDAIMEALHAAHEPLDEDLVLVPAVFDVMLHPGVYQELRSLLPRVKTQAITRLDRELERLNAQEEGPVARTLRRLTLPLYRFFFADRLMPGSAARRGATYERAGEAWHVDFVVTAERDADASYLVVETDFGTPRRNELRGRPTVNVRRRTTRLPDGRFETVITARRPPATRGHRATGAAPTTDVLARLIYEDSRGRHVYYMRKDVITIGRRDAPDSGLDIALDTMADVSRQHARIRREGDDRFAIQNVSRFGATVNGARVPAGDEAGESGGDVWHPLPPQAEIGLANAVFIYFEAL